MHFCNFWSFFWSEESKHIRARCCGGRGVFLKILFWGLKKLFWKIVVLFCFSMVGQIQTKALSPFVILSHFGWGGGGGSSTKLFWGPKELFWKITVLSSFSMVGQIFKLSSRKCLCYFQIIQFCVVKNIQFWLGTFLCLVKISHFFRDPNLLKFTSLTSVCSVQIYYSEFLAVFPLALSVSSRVWFPLTWQREKHPEVLLKLKSAHQRNRLCSSTIDPAVGLLSTSSRSEVG